MLPAKEKYRRGIEGNKRREEKAMKCPLFQAGWLMKDNVGTSSEADCLKEDCAWWNSELNQCDPTGLLPWLKNIEGHLEELVDKMPHEEQFRK